MEKSTATQKEQRAALESAGVLRFDLLKDAEDRAYVLSVIRRVVAKKHRRKTESRG